MNSLSFVDIVCFVVVLTHFVFISIIEESFDLITEKKENSKRLMVKRGIHCLTTLKSASSSLQVCLHSQFKQRQQYQALGLASVKFNLIKFSLVLQSLKVAADPGFLCTP